MTLSDAHLRFYFLLLNVMILQQLTLTNSRRLSHHRGTLEPRKLLRRGTDFEAEDRFAKLYSGKNWAEVTQLPHGWEIIDFGAPEPANSLRFRNGHNLDAPREDEYSNLRCYENANGEIHCAPPPKQDPNHGIDKDDSDALSEANGKSGVESKGLGTTAINKNKQPDPLKMQDEEKKPATKDAEQPPNDNKQSNEKTPPDSSKKGPFIGVIGGGNDNKQSDEKPPPDSSKNGLVVGGGYVITLEVCVNLLNYQLRVGH